MKLTSSVILRVTISDRTFILVAMSTNQTLRYNIYFHVQLHLLIFEATWLHQWSCLFIYELWTARGKNKPLPHRGRFFKHLRVRPGFPKVSICKVLGTTPSPEFHLTLRHSARVGRVCLPSSESLGCRVLWGQLWGASVPTSLAPSASRLLAPASALHSRWYHVLACHSFLQCLLFTLYSGC